MNLKYSQSLFILQFEFTIYNVSCIFKTYEFKANFHSNLFQKTALRKYVHCLLENHVPIKQLDYELKISMK